MKCWIDQVKATVLIKALQERADSAVDEVFAAAAPALEEYAKRNAPWTDRTGRARRTLTGCTQCVPYGKKILAIAGQMSYSPGLELLYGGRYSILYPTLLRHFEGVLNDTANAVGGVTLETA